MFNLGGSALAEKRFDVYCHTHTHSQRRVLAYLVAIHEFLNSF